jgi:hypothetical protein
MSVARVRRVFAEHTILRSLLIVALGGLALWIISVQISAYNDLQWRPAPTISPRWRA